MLDSTALDTLFRTARTFSAGPHTWLPTAVSEEQLRQVWDLAKMGPTSANCGPARVVFVTTSAGKDKLAPALDEGNLRRTMEAPATAIVGMDMAFYEKLPYLFPHTDAKSWFAGKPDNIRTTAMRNSSLQGAYLIIAARALGLDCGPMSGFDNGKVDAAFFAGTQITSNFLINLGYGNRATLHPRNPRLSFDEACSIA
jgi:3-hydroxypropanoate dehydrogenase